MMFVITYVSNVETLKTRGIELCNEGKWDEYMIYEGGLKLNMTKVKTAYSADYPDNKATLCLLKLPLKDIIGDEEDPDYVPFCTDMGLDILAYGEGCYVQLQNCPVALAKYRNVLPDVELLDNDGEGTGVFKFDHYREYDAPIRS